MATLRRPIRLDSMDGEQSLQLDALVDTGSFVTIVPASLLKELGVVPTEKVGLELAGGRRVAWDIGEARATVDGHSTATLVVFGEEDADPVLGRYTLTGLCLDLDPVRKILVPVPLFRRGAPRLNIGADRRARELMRAYIRMR